MVDNMSCPEKVNNASQSEKNSNNENKLYTEETAQLKISS